MPAFAASAPGKVILFGEHAVVYERPAIAAPVTQVSARVSISANPTGPQGQIWIAAKDIRLNQALSDLSPDHPFAIAIQGVKEAVGAASLPALRLQISSTIPMAAGMGSGAAVSVAIARALSAFLGRPLADDLISAIAFRVDQKYHGTPSGIDNTVIAHAQPIFFVKNKPFERLVVRQPFTLVIASTGIESTTGKVVGDVRQRWLADKNRWELLFDEIGEIACRARELIEAGSPHGLGPLMTRNHQLLKDLSVSSPELDHLVEIALQGGALGAKLVGAGRGGNMIALVEENQAQVVAGALTAGGAVRTITTAIRNK